MLKHRLVFATLAAALAACGTEDTTPTPEPEPELEDPVAYFGLEPCTCYEYVPEGGGAQRLGVAVESVTTDVAGNTDGAEEYVVRYRLGGREVRQDVLRPTNPDLLLRMVELADEQPQTTWRSEPPLPWLTFPVEPRDQALTTDVTMSQPGTDVSEEVSFRANYSAATVEGSLDGETTESFDATRIFFQGLPWNELPRWFVPEMGMVNLELQLDGSRTQWVLDRKVTLGGGCPWGYGDRPDDDQICGTLD